MYNHITLDNICLYFVIISGFVDIIARILFTICSKYLYPIPNIYIPSQMFISHPRYLYPIPIAY